MRGVFLVPGRLDVFWLDQGLGMNHTTWADLLGWPADTNQSGNFTALGGVFTSPPIAVSMSPDRVDVFGLGSDYALHHRYLEGATWSAGWERLGGDLTSPPAVLASAIGGVNRLDVFALGPDQAMMQISWTSVGWTGWKQLGGCFTTPPVAIAGANGRIDLFSRGPDGILYQSAFIGGDWNDWTLLGGPLLAEPAAASMPAAVRWGNNNLDVFTVGFDGALWHLAWDGIRWHPWESLGGQFTSEPVAFATQVPNVIVTPGPVVTGGATETAEIYNSQTHNRFDIFVVGPDYDGTRQMLWQVTKDQSGWGMGNAEIGPLIGLPAIISAENAVGLGATGGPAFMAVSPATTMRLTAQVFNAATVQYHLNGPPFRTTATYLFSIDKISIDSTRSLHDDTDQINASVGVERWPILKLNYDMGDVNSGNYPLDQVKLGPFTVELCERLVCSYMIINSDNSDTASFIAETTAKGLEDWINDLLKGTPVLANDIYAGASLSGSLLGALLRWVLKKHSALRSGEVMELSLSRPSRSMAGLYRSRWDRATRLAFKRSTTVPISRRYSACRRSTRSTGR
jgi:hypothetical protein